MSHPGSQQPRSTTSRAAAWVAAASQLITLLDGATTQTDAAPRGPPSAASQPAPHSRDAELCELTETQELPDGFFALYAPHPPDSPPHGSQQRDQYANSGGCEREKRAALGTSDALLGGEEEEWAVESHRGHDSNGIEHPQDGVHDDEGEEEEEGEEEDDDDDDAPVGRTAGHHAQQSQYAGGEEEDEEEEGDEEGSADAAGSLQAEERQGENGSDTSAQNTETTALPRCSHAAASPAQKEETDRVAAVDGTEASAETKGSAHGTIKTSAVAPEEEKEAPRRLSSAGVDAAPQADAVLWPFAQPPSLTALPHYTQTRAAFHTHRYGVFIKAYLGLSDQEVRQAERRGRGICMMGVRKVTRYGKSSSSPNASFSFVTPRGMAKCAAANFSSPHHPFRCIRPYTAEPVKAQRVFLRHSVLSVEGDAVFCQLIDRAETLYAVEQQRLDAAAAAYWTRGRCKGEVDEGEEAEGKEESDSPASPAGGAATAASFGESVMYPQFRKLPRVAEPYLRPNARCIALHYGLPESSGASSSDDPTTTTASSPPRLSSSPSFETPASRFPRATLIAVVSTTRMEEGSEIYVSMESYYRCLDEVAWYRRCYAQLNARYGCSTDLTPPSDAPHHTKKTNQAAMKEKRDVEGKPLSSLCVSGIGVNDIYTGVKRFAAWPAELAYYHGVGRRHASATAESAFPFTLVDLGAAPELGEDQKGVVASAWLPYGTCLLYCGPSVATRKVEKVVRARVLEEESGGPTGNEDENEREEGEDLSFVTDDTYALGLGRHGVCFGQGLTRYINHRYNASRFGNVELCSVMLSVPSEFAEEAREKGGGVKAGRSRTKQRGSGTLADPSLTEEESTQIRRAVKKAAATAAPSRSSGLVESSGTGTAAAAANTTASLATHAPPLRVKRKAPPARRTQRIFLEEKSYFVTVPFFLVTTDIAPGTPLLAWTYGEDYDAKLERQAVADGHLVPFADAVLLNQRLATASLSLPLPGVSSSVSLDKADAAARVLQSASLSEQPTRVRQFQRYTGDYRYAIGVGDVVWRRRPLLEREGEDQLAGLPPELLVAPPEEDLFVVVQTPRGGAEQVLLLRQLDRVPLTNDALSQLLKEQHLIDYVSPHVTVNSEEAVKDGEHERDGATTTSRGGGGKARHQRVSSVVATHKRRRKPSSQAASTATANVSAHWAVFTLPDGDLGNLTSSTLPTARAEEALRRCVVATIDTVGLLLSDVDYSVIHTSSTTSSSSAALTTSGSGGSNGVHGRTKKHTRRVCGGGRSSGNGGDGGGTVSAPAVPSLSLRAGTKTSRSLIVNLDDLHHATLLVRRSVARATAVPPLVSGLVWPLFSAQLERGGGAVGAAAAAETRRSVAA